MADTWPAGTFSHPILFTHPPDYHAEADVELAKGGFHIAPIAVASMLGRDESLAIMDRFHGFADEAALVAYDGDPLDLREPVTKAKIPLRHVISWKNLVGPAGEDPLEAKRRLGKLGWEIDLLVVDPATTINDGHHFPLVGIADSVAFIRKHTGIP